MPELTLSIIEIIVLMLGAIILGITIHFFIVSRRNLKPTPANGQEKITREASEWKAKYLTEIEMKDRELASLRDQVEEERENTRIYEIEAEELRQKNKNMQALLSLQNNAAVSTKASIAEQLKQTYDGLSAQNEKINALIEQIGMFKETEEKIQQLSSENEELFREVGELKLKLSAKEGEIAGIRQKAHLTKEMSSLLDNAYTEFSALQTKLEKLEAEASSSRMLRMEYENLKEESLKLARDFESTKQKMNAAVSENQELKTKLTQSEDKLRESEFQRQQLQKNLAYLEGVTSEMDSVTDANKRLEAQIKRIGELESMLNVMAEEREQMIRRHAGSE